MALPKKVYVLQDRDYLNAYAEIPRRFGAGETYGEYVLVAKIKPEIRLVRFPLNNSELAS